MQNRLAEIDALYVTHDDPAGEAYGIREGVSNLRIPHQDSTVAECVTVSMGAALCIATDDKERRTATDWRFDTAPPSAYAVT